MSESSAQLIRLVASLVAGLLFGAGMILSGMVDPEKVTGFLDISGQWDPSLAFVMAGALLVFAPFYHLLIKKRKWAINGEPLPTPPSKSINVSLVSGAVIFGIGWGLAGFCPGPVIASLGGGETIIFVFTASMIPGMLLARKFLAGDFRLLGFAKNTTGENRCE